MNLDPRLLVTFGTAIVFEIVFPLVVGFYIHRRYGARWKLFVYGALVFFLSQMLTRIPLVQVAQSLLAPTLQSSQTFLYIWLGVLSLTAGIFEEIGRYVGYRVWLKRDRTWEAGLMYGAGHGGLESMLLVGGLALLGLVNIIAISMMTPAQLNLPPEQLAQFEAARQQIAAIEWWMPLLGAYERFITIFFHIALSILVLQTFLRNSMVWLVSAILLHGAVNFIVVVLAQQVGPVWTEVALTLALPLSFGIIYYFRPRGIQNAPEIVAA